MIGGVMVSVLIASAGIMKPSAITQDKGDICVSVATLWTGSLAETKRIADDPVPESYRRLYGWTGCRYLRKETLIDWHLAFGNEQSATQALDFLEDSARKGMPSPAVMATDLPAA